jgi:type II secretory pathway pseudopilin PulG
MLDLEMAMATVLVLVLLASAAFSTVGLLLGARAVDVRELGSGRVVATALACSAAVWTPVLVLGWLIPVAGLLAGFLLGLLLSAPVAKIALGTPLAKSMLMWVFHVVATGFATCMALALLLSSGTFSDWMSELAERQKVQITSTQFDTLEGRLDAFQRVYGRYPTTAEGLQALTSPPAGPDGLPVEPLLDDGMLLADVWETAIEYRFPARSPEHQYELISLGSDRVSGGVGTAADIVRGGPAPQP